MLRRHTILATWTGSVAVLAGVAAWLQQVLR